MALKWTYGDEGDPNVIAQDILTEHQPQLEFYQLTGESYEKYVGLETSVISTKDSPLPSRGLIREYRDLSSKGGTSLRIPVQVPNDTPAEFGDTDMTNKGVHDDIVWIQSGVNRWRLAQTLVSGMERQTIGKAISDRMNQATSQLKYRLARQINQDLHHTMVNGVSINMCNLSGKGQVNTTIPPHSHSNFYIGGSLIGGGGYAGYPNSRPVSAAYETDVYGGLNALTSADKFTPEMVENLEFFAQKLDMPMFQTKMGDMWVIVVPIESVRDFKRNEDYLKFRDSAFNGSEWNAIGLTSKKAVWSNTIIIGSRYIPGVRLNASNDPGSVQRRGVAFNEMPVYGASDFYTSVGSIDSSPLKLGYFLSPNAIIRAYGLDGLQIEGDRNAGADRDEIYLNFTAAHVLSEYKDSDNHIVATGTDPMYKNQSSMVFAHWAA